VTPARGNRPSAGPSPGGDRLVLVVDDEPDLLEIVSDRLRGAGYRVVTACDGLEALARARMLRPECVILDLKMPRLGGFDALPGLREALPHAHILVLTGSPNRPLGDACRSRGADDFLLKPFDPGDLLRRLARAVPGQRGR
jgi:CheY-like chemotaxis protein